MRKIVGTLMLVLFLFGCSDSDTEAVTEKNFVGSWVQVNTGSAPKMNATISKADDGYIVEIRLPVPNQAPVVVSKPGKLQGDVLIADGLEKIQIDDSTGHLMIGVNEFELVQ